jgi:geranylgeranyl diphosphate synthase type II
VKSIEKYIEKHNRIINSELKKYFKSYRPLSKLLTEAMSYTLFSAGKRLRPILTLAVCDALDREHKLIMPAALAVEMIHNFSLIHDDLPCMDNDDIRRGKPTSHKVFGEAVALLAGDALLTEAFKVITKCAKYPELKNENIVKAVSELAFLSGSGGMTAGQVLDITTDKHRFSLDMIKKIHYCKTGALIEASCRLPALILGASESQFKSINIYAKNIGLVYQIIDDLLDNSQNSDEFNFIRFYGKSKALKLSRELTEEAVDKLKIFSNKGKYLKDIALFLLNRKK